MSLIAQDVAVDTRPPPIAEMPPFFLWGKQSSIGIRPGDSWDVIQAKMSIAVNALAGAEVVNSLGYTISPETGHKPS
jgi:hypothetical protein